MKGLDVGCGVGGPMRTIASTSGAEITGITINDYQVKRGEYHNGKVTVIIQRGLWQACAPKLFAKDTLRSLECSLVMLLRQV